MKIYIYLKKQQAFEKVLGAIILPMGNGLITPALSVLDTFTTKNKM